MTSAWDPPIPERDPRSPKRVSATHRRIARTGFFLYLSLFVVAPLAGWEVGERVSPLVPNPEYQPAEGPQIRVDCYTEYGRGGSASERCDYYDVNPAMVRRYGSPSLYLFAAFWSAVFVLPKLKARFVKRFWESH